MTTADPRPVAAVVDDDEMQRTLLTAYLAPVYDVETATDVSGLHKIMARRKVAVVVLDLNLGSTRGLDTLRRAMEHVTGYVPPVVVLTASTDLSSECRKTGAAAVLIKGAPQDEVLRTLAAARECAEGMERRNPTVRLMAGALDAVLELATPIGETAIAVAPDGPLHTRLAGLEQSLTDLRAEVQAMAPVPVWERAVVVASALWANIIIQRGVAIALFLLAVGLALRQLGVWNVEIPWKLLP